jgi:hypothetical protein
MSDTRQIQQYTTDARLLLVTVYLRGRDNHGYTGATGDATITFTPPAGGVASTRSLISRGGGRFELQLVADDVTVVGIAWVDVTSPIGAWADFSTAIQIYTGVAPPPPPIPLPVQDAVRSVRSTAASRFRQPRSRSVGRRR